LETASLPNEQSNKSEFQTRASTSISIGKSGAIELNDPKLELGMWLMALRSYFQVHNQPFPEGDHSGAFTHNWKSEIKVVCRCLLRASQLAVRLVHDNEHQDTVFGISDEFSSLNALLVDSEETRDFDHETTRSLIELAEVMSDLVVTCEALSETRTINFQTWTSIGNILTRELERSDGGKKLTQFARNNASAKMPLTLQVLVREKVKNSSLGNDMILVFSTLARLLEWLSFVEYTLHRDHPLKLTLPVFTLLHEEAQALLDMIDNRVLKIEGLEQDIFDTLDGTSYAVKMELKKVYARELVGISEMKHSPTIYGKLENSHGLLRNSFQQSTVALAHAFNSSFDGSSLFSSFQTRLEQSLLLRKDLWHVLQVVRRAEKEGENFVISKLHDTLLSFRNSSMHYLMFKDWEASERFIDEVNSARGAAELAPVLHRYGAYLETLHGQICMRAVLANHPFDYPEVNI
jgi:hypothetical protein